MCWRTISCTISFCLIFSSFMSNSAVSQQDGELSACGGLNPKEVSDLIQAIKCIKQLAAKIELVECASLDAERKGDTIKAAICAGNFAEKYLAFEEASQQGKVDAATKIGTLNTKVQALERRLAGVKVDAWHKFSIGEYDSGSRVRPRYYCGDDAKVRARALCGSLAKPFVFTVDVRNGDKCGYHDVVVACVTN